MLDCIITGEIPKHLDCKILPGHNWKNLQFLWNKVFPESNISFASDGIKWSLKETIDSEIKFHMERDQVSLNRNTIVDTYGLIGTSMLDLTQSSVILTEGVSDFITVKLLCPYRNVLGVITLGGSRNAKAILVNLFENFTIVADNDETGISNAHKWKKFLNSYQKSVNLFIPPIGKDITDSFIFNLKLNQ